jgi:hypothetical protein
MNPAGHAILIGCAVHLLGSALPPCTSSNRAKSCTNACAKSATAGNRADAKPEQRSSGSPAQHLARALALCE